MAHNIKLDRRSFLATSACMAGAGLLVSALDACSTNSQSSGSTTNTPSKGGTLKFGSSTATPSDRLDPSRQLSNLEIIAIGTMFDSLIRLDNNFTPQPGLVTSWKSNKDATLWTLEVRPDVAFHDGTPLTAKDVAYSIARNVDPNGVSPVVGLLGPYLKPDEIQVVNPATLRLHLSEPYAFVPLVLGNRYLRAIKDGTKNFDKPIGTGPFKFESFDPGQQFAVRRNAEYWGKPVLLDGIRSENIPDQSSLFQSLLTGEVDAIEQIDFSQVPAAKSNNTTKLVVLPDQFIPSVDINLTVAPFDKPGVVEAMKLALDRQQIVDAVYQGLGSVGYDTPVPKSDPSFDTTLPSPTKDIGRAKQLLAEAGLARGFSHEFNVSEVGPSMTAFGQAVSQQLKAIDVDLKIKVVPASTFWDQTWLKADACTPIYVRRPANEILSYIGSTGGGFNGTHFSSKEFDGALNDARRSSDEASAMKHLQEAQGILSRQGGNLIPAFAPLIAASASRTTVMPSRVHMIDFSQAYLS